MSEPVFDLLIIGGGPGGYVAAIRAAQLGFKTALVEKAQLGGVCLNWGCIPTKTLLRSADVLRLVRDATRFGIHTASPELDLPAMIARSRAVAAQLNTGVTGLLKKHGVTVLTGHARLQGGGTVAVSDGNHRQQHLRAAHIVLATGARARQLPQLPADHPDIWTYRQALTPPSLPGRLLIIGAGAIGIEFASFYHTLGSEVTVVDMATRILPQEDADISAEVTRCLQRDGIQVQTQVTLKQAERVGDHWQVALQTQDPAQVMHVDADIILAAAGIVGNVENLGLENTGVHIHNHHIQTDAWCRTGEPDVYAIGDVAGPPWLAHKASHEGVLCVESIAGLPVHALNRQRIPACTYSHPQVASIGLSETQAKSAGHAVKVGMFPFAANGKAMAMGNTTGFVKTVFDAASGELLGAHMVGDDVTEMIQGFAIAQSLETTETDLIATILPHPSLSESMHEAVLAAYGRALHI